MAAEHKEAEYGQLLWANYQNALFCEKPADRGAVGAEDWPPPISSSLFPPLPPTETQRTLSTSEAPAPPEVIPTNACSAERIDGLWSSQSPKGPQAPERCRERELSDRSLAPPEEVESGSPADPPCTGCTEEAVATCPTADTGGSDRQGPGSKTPLPGPEEPSSTFCADSQALIDKDTGGRGLGLGMGTETTWQTPTAASVSSPERLSRDDHETPRLADSPRSDPTLTVGAQEGVAEFLPPVVNGSTTPAAQASTPANASTPHARDSSDIEAQVAQRLDAFFADDAMWRMAYEVSTAQTGQPLTGRQVATDRDGRCTFRVQVPRPYPGVQYRRSMNPDDRYPRYVANGIVVTGTVVEGGEWLQIKETVFLPMRVGTVRILEPYP